MILGHPVSWGRRRGRICLSVLPGSGCVPGELSEPWVGILSLAVDMQSHAVRKYRRTSCLLFLYRPFVYLSF